MTNPHIDTSEEDEARELAAMTPNPAAAAEQLKAFLGRLKAQRARHGRKK